MIIETTRRAVLWLGLCLAASLVALPGSAQNLPPYTAKAGMLAIGPEAGLPGSEIFHVAYTLDGADPAVRPVTFVWNGGPGGASILLHMSALGPRTIATAGDGSFPASPARLEPNPDSWIAFTDLVFIDPVGTGYSRTLPGPDGAPVDPAPYYTTMGDLDSFGIFIRQWLTANWPAPIGWSGFSLSA
jgi:carboxypeptidase C (cathepsin A)